MSDYICFPKFGLSLVLLEAAIISGKWISESPLIDSWDISAGCLYSNSLHVQRLSTVYRKPPLVARSSAVTHAHRPRNPPPAPCMSCAHNPWPPQYTAESELWCLSAEIISELAVVVRASLLTSEAHEEKTQCQCLRINQPRSTMSRSPV